MTRPPLQPRREDVAAEELDAYDAVIARVRTRLGQPAGTPDEHFDAGPYFGVMLTSPTLCHLASQMGAYLVTRGNHPGSYSHADREFAEQVLCATWKTNAGQNVHIPDASRSWRSPRGDRSAQKRRMRRSSTTMSGY